MNIVLNKINFKDETIDILFNGETFIFKSAEFNDNDSTHSQIVSKIQEKIDHEKKELEIFDFMIENKIFDLYKLPNCGSTNIEEVFLVKLLFLDKNKKIIEIVKFKDGKEEGDGIMVTVNSLISSVDKIVELMRIDDIKEEKLEKKKQNSLNFLN